MYKVTTKHEIDGEVERGAFADKTEAEAMAEHYRVCGGFLQIVVSGDDSETTFGPREGEVTHAETPKSKKHK